MKISYQQLFIIFICMSHSISAITLYNESKTPIRFNIFKKNFAEHYNFNPLPKNFGKISPLSFKNIKNLDPNSYYIVTFYDIYNCKNNRIFTIKGNTDKLFFKIDDLRLSID